MQFDEIRNEVIAILRDSSPLFLSAYQICHRIEGGYPALWQRLIREYPSTNPATPMGEGTGQYYSPASFVGNALKHYFNKVAIQGLRQEYFDCKGVLFSGVEAGFTGKEIGIWAL
jgi:hypothetical protein